MRAKIRGLVSCLVLLACALAVVTLFDSARAQDDTVDPSTLQELEKRLGNQDTNELPLKPTVQTLQPAIPLRTDTTPSALEQRFSERAGRRLKQFGYDTLGASNPVTVSGVGAVQDDYILGQGDEVIVTLRGQQNSTYRTRVNRDGQVVLPKLAPIMAAGRAFGDFRKDLEAQVAQAFISTSVSATVGELRQISVLVSGGVRIPGVRMLSALSSPIDALLLSGGVSKSGSLRAIQLITGHGRIIRTIDLYTVLAEGGAGKLGTMQDGDKIYVPPIGATVAIAGSINRPGIYELSPGARSISSRALMRLAGGVEIAGAYRFSKSLLERDGTTRLSSVSENSSLKSGEVLFVDTSRDVSVDRVDVKGAVAVTGARPLAGFASVGALLHSVDDLKPDAYTQFAVIARRDKDTNARILVPVSLYQIFKGRGDVPLQNDDTVFVFSNDEMEDLARAATNTAEPHRKRRNNSSDMSLASSDENVGNNRTDENETSGGNPDRGDNNSDGSSAQNPSQDGTDQDGQQGTTRDGLPAQKASTQSSDLSDRTVDQPQSADPRLESARRMSGRTSEALNEANRTISAEHGENQVEDTDARLGDLLGVSPRAVMRVVSDHVVWVLGEVGDPRAYVAAPGSDLEGMILTAGGPQRDADLSQVEVTSTVIDAANGTSHTVRAQYSRQSAEFQTVSVQPQDVIRLRAVFSDRQEGRVTVTGEVRYPGTFDVARGEKLSSLLQRAGGLTPEAYPYGAVFTRKSAALEERAGNERAVHSLNSEVGRLIGLQASSTNGQSNTTAATVALLSSLSGQLRDEPTLGRISVIADPAVISAKPSADILLEAGDTLYIPPRPSTVTVTGEVLNAGSFRYNRGLNADAYVKLAGGTTSDSDDDRIFVVFPDGSAQPIDQGNWLVSGGNAIPPGSTIVVPRDLHPFDLNQFALNVVQIVSQLAITGASLSVIAHN